MGIADPDEALRDDKKEEEYLEKAEVWLKWAMLPVANLLDSSEFHKQYSQQGQR